MIELGLVEEDESENCELKIVGDTCAIMAWLS